MKEFNISSATSTRSKSSHNNTGSLVWLYRFFSRFYSVNGKLRVILTKYIYERPLLWMWLCCTVDWFILARISFQFSHGESGFILVFVQSCWNKYAIMWAGSDITSSSSDSLVWRERQTASWQFNLQFIALWLSMWLYVDVVRDGRRPVLN